MARAADFLTARHTAERVRHALAANDDEYADRYISEVAARILAAPEGTAIPAEVVDRPDSTGRLEYDTLLATAMAYALQQRGLEPPGWMTESARLPAEWLWGVGYEPLTAAYWDFVKARTPQMFLAKNLLLRDRALRTP